MIEMTQECPVTLLKSKKCNPQFSVNAGSYVFLILMLMLVESIFYYDGNLHIFCYILVLER